MPTTTANRTKIQVQNVFECVLFWWIMISIGARAVTMSDRNSCGDGRIQDECTSFASHIRRPDAFFVSCFGNDKPTFVCAFGSQLDDGEICNIWALGYVLRASSGVFVCVTHSESQQENVNGLLLLLFHSMNNTKRTRQCDAANKMNN